ncbi:Phosphatidylinositol 3-kinase catalytic subunit type 3 [Aphelenchoides fujianensis]|nr:Phosphatidylinositol 3-kinase catalytic subunit type 3 [Aphelenchoides fujianensis]
MKKEFTYVCSGELHVPIRLQVLSLSGYGRTAGSSGEMLLKVAVYCNRRKVGPDVCTRHTPARAVGGARRELQTWGEWLQLPLAYSEATADTLLHFTLWDVRVERCFAPALVAQCSRRLFSKHGILRAGRHDLRLQRGEPDSPDQPPAPQFGEAGGRSRVPAAPDIAVFLKKEKLYKEQYIDPVEWLDGVTFSKLEELKLESRTEDRCLYLHVKMPTVTGGALDPAAYEVLFYVADLRDAVGRPADDPEAGLENLCETKHHMLTRNTRAGDIDRRLQPNSLYRDMLEQIIRMPTLQPMSMEERDVIWKFRFWLRSNPNALTKFVRSVNWDEKLEVKQAIQVLREWEPIDACDALELLGPTFAHPFVRRYAVGRLQTTPHATLLLYLPQLVQSLRYESALKEEEEDNEETGENAPLLLDAPTAAPSCSRASAEPDVRALIAEVFGADLDMASFLIETAGRNSTIANFLYWYLKVEVEANAASDPRMSAVYAQLLERLKRALAAGTNVARKTLSTLHAQLKFVETLGRISGQVAARGGGRARKLEHLKELLAASPELTDLKGLALPLDPAVQVKQVLPESSVLFSSKLMPMRLTFSTVRGFAAPFEYGEAYTTIFKRGDDLRQDQLVLQMIRLMDGLLKEDKLDLCLTPYAVLATSLSDGFVQFVKATPIADLKSILDTLRTYRPSATGPFGIEADVVENYVRSCAGYSMICYVLGIGDRHMHNLLLCENGRMFHVDFGYILGRDPKPMPPPMKLTAEMINAMGGQNSEHFAKFIDYCTTGFLIVRRHANLIINLFSLMLDASIPDIMIEKDKAVHTILERFHLQLSDEDACKELNRVIQSSISAKMPILSDFVHDVRQLIS